MNESTVDALGRLAGTIEDGSFGSLESVDLAIALLEAACCSATAINAKWLEHVLKSNPGDPALAETVMVAKQSLDKLSGTPQALGVAGQLGQHLGGVARILEVVRRLDRGGEPGTATDENQG